MSRSIVSPGRIAEFIGAADKGLDGSVSWRRAVSTRVVATAIAVTVIAVAVGAESMRYYLEDLPRGGLARRLTFPDDTEYAPDFKESNFARIVPGMSIDEVVGIIGMPLRIVEATRLFPIREYGVANGKKILVHESRDAQAERQIHYYSRAGRYWDSYYIRTVTFDSNGYASQVDRNFYSD